MPKKSLADPVIKEMTCSEYAAIRNITPDAVRNAIKKNHNLPGVISKQKKSFVWFFTVNVEQAKN